MYIIIFLQGFVFYGPVATLYRQSRGLSMYNMFLIESISWILMILFEVPWGLFSDRYGYKKTMVISCFLLFISKIVFYRAFSISIFLLERILMSLAFAGMSGCDIALLYSSVNEEETEKVFGMYNSISNAGLLIASLISTIIIKKSLSATAFYTIIPYGLAFIFAFFLKEIPIETKGKPQFKKSFRDAFKNWYLVLFIVSLALAREVTQSVCVFLNQGQYVRSGINIKYFGILLALTQVIRLGSAKSYNLSEKFGVYKSINILYIFLSCSVLMLIFTGNKVLSVLGISLISGAMALIEPMSLKVQNKEITTGDRATILSMYAMVSDLISAFVNPVIGKVADISLVAALITCFLFCFVGIILLYIYKRTLSKQLKKSSLSL